MNNTLKNTNPFLYWTPRILAILLVALLAVMSFDVIGQNYGFWGTALALLIHNIPMLVMLAVLIISWKYEIVGGISFIIAGLAYIVLLAASRNFEWFMLSWIAQISGVAFLIAILFLVGWHKKRSENTSKLDHPQK